MASPPRITLPGTTVLLTCRVQKGLPFVATLYMANIIWSYLARAQTLFPITISHFLVMGNHIHFIIVVRNPENVSAFMDHFKTETAHVINRLLGKTHHSFWGASFDCVPILTVDDVIEKIGYVYTNPQKADLIRTIEEYPGVSSWEMWQGGVSRKVVPTLRRVYFSKLRKFKLSRKEQRRLADEIVAQSKETQTFTLSPDAWMQTFGITDPEEMRDINKRIVKRVRELELEYEEKRIREGKGVLGPDYLIDRPLDADFEPKKFQKRAWCICRDIPRRVQFIQFLKKLRAQAIEVRERWRVGDYSVPYPLGLFPPRMHRLGNLVPGFLS
jgi:REP element-mobilizing transposase RayT